MTSPTPITGTVVSVSVQGEAAPGEARYGINFARADGSFVSGTTGHTTIFAYVWPDYARVEPSRMIGRRVHGLELTTGHLWWMFIEPPAGARCDTAEGGGQIVQPTVPGTDIPAPPPPPGGVSDTNSTPIGGGGGTA